jgi:hypothetical protein
LGDVESSLVGGRREGRKARRCGSRCGGAAQVASGWQRLGYRWVMDIWVISGFVRDRWVAGFGWKPKNNHAVPLYLSMLSSLSVLFYSALLVQCL